MSKEQILKEFYKKFINKDSYLEKAIPSLDIKKFISKVISQTREETIKEIRNDFAGEIFNKKLRMKKDIFQAEEVLDILNKLNK